MAIQTINFNNVERVSFNNNFIKEIKFNNTTIWRDKFNILEHLVLTPIDSNGKQTDDKDFNGTISAYAIGKATIFWLKEITPTPSTQEEYLGNYYEKESGYYILITENNISDITVGTTKCYQRTTNKNEATVQHYSFDTGYHGLDIDSYQGPINLPSTYNNKPVTTIYRKALSPDNYLTPKKPIFLTEIVLPSTITTLAASSGIGTIYANKIYINADITTGGSPGSQVLVADELIIGANVTSLPSYFHYGNGSPYNSEDPYFRPVGRTLKLTFDNSSSLSSIASYAFGGTTFSASIILPNSITSLGNSAFETSNFSNPTDYIQVPESVTTFGESSLAFNTDSTIKFMHSSTTTVDSSSIIRAFKYKGARSYNIWTDNQAIHDADYASIEVTPTFYHLDGTPWE